MLRHALRFGAIAGIECRLAATGLTLVKFDFATGPAQDLDRAGADAAPHLINDAGNEQADLDGRSALVVCRLRIHGNDPTGV